MRRTIAPQVLLRKILRAVMHLKAVPAWGLVLLIFFLTIFMYRFRNELTYFKTGENLDDYTEIFQQPPLKYLEITQNGCLWPLLSPTEKEIEPFVTYYRSIHCNSDMPNLANLLDDGRLLITTELEIWKRNQVPEFKCSVRPLSGALHPNITEYTLGDEFEVPYNVPTFIPHDQFVVQCFNQTTYAYVNGKPRVNGEKIYEKAFVNYAGVYPKVRKEQQRFALEDPPQEKATEFTAADPMNPSLAILVLDSTSLNQFLRHMPETTEFMRKQNFVTMNMYNKVGDNSAVNLLPVLAGRPIQTDPNNADPEDQFVVMEDVKFIWDIMKERGCATMLNDDIMDPTRGLFHYPNHTFKGFTKKPTDFYLRPYHVYNNKHRVTPVTSGQCMKDGTITHVEYLSNMFEFSKLFKDYCHFSFNFLTALTHDDPSYIGAMDHNLRVTLERFFENGIADNTALVIMGDHGNRINEIKKTFTGRVEERNPFFAIHLPEKYRKVNIGKFYNLRLNANRLISNYDIHKLLREIALGPNKDTNTPEWGVPLLSEQVEWNRTCEMAHIPTNFCLCMEYYAERSNATDNETETFKNVSTIMQKYLSELPCVTSVEFHGGYDHVDIYSLNQMVLHGLRDQRGYADLINQTVEADIEFLDFGMRAFSPPRSRDGEQFNFGSVGRFKHYKKTGEMELCTSPRIIERSVICNAAYADQICEMCYTDNLIAPVNEMLLD